MSGAFPRARLSNSALTGNGNGAAIEESATEVAAYARTVSLVSLKHRRHGWSSATGSIVEVAARTRVASVFGLEDA